MKTPPPAQLAKCQDGPYKRNGEPEPPKLSVIIYWKPGRHGRTAQQEKNLANLRLMICSFQSPYDDVISLKPQCVYAITLDLKVFRQLSVASSTLRLPFFPFIFDEV
ncbi:hypothetical protein IB237_14905 [Agrobacterium sp. AGB01]|uniref:hypothetical protein n=1 Tax=Agrobacterium sp. AGB01 TaxID=2769302 RepID=UPI0017802A69|nr:hypothetical protein [Agrobacterium sp. AGB01]MBD9388471.1 hypothetical protein [Agrobacterium sp. AGB01]